MKHKDFKTYFEPSYIFFVELEQQFVEFRVGVYGSTVSRRPLALKVGRSFPRDPRIRMVKIS
jgi:hypothetical protein